MRIFCIIFLVCLIGIGSVSALSVNPAAVPALKTLAPTQQPTMVAVLAKPQTLVSDVWVSLEINSLPSGATVTVDGQSTMQGATPYKVALHPGSHTILLTLDGYKDFTTTVNLQAGNPVAFDAQLQKVITAAAVRENIAAANTVVAQHVTLRTIAPAGDNTIACLSGQECLTLAEAGERFAPGWYYTEGSVCGYNGSIAKYCISGSPKMAVQQGAVQAAAAIQSENKVTGDNARSSITGSPSPSPSATPRILGAQRQAGIIDSILGFFGGLFGQKVTCPPDARAMVVCGGECVNLNTDSQHCGACDYTCFEPAVCCGGECVDLQEDIHNCGSCRMTCSYPTICREGDCINPTEALQDSHGNSGPPVPTPF